MHWTEIETFRSYREIRPIRGYAVKHSVIGFLQRHTMKTSASISLSSGTNAGSGALVVDWHCDHETRSGIQLLTAMVMVIAFGLGMYSSAAHLQGQHRTGSYSKIEVWPVKEVIHRVSVDPDGT
jgi:hypothetical protein